MQNPQSRKAKLRSLVGPTEVHGWRALRGPALEFSGLGRGRNALHLDR